MQAFKDLEGKTPAQDGDPVALLVPGDMRRVSTDSRAYHTALAQHEDIEQAIAALDQGDVKKARATLELARSLSAWMARTD